MLLEMLFRQAKYEWGGGICMIGPHAEFYTVFAQSLFKEVKIVNV